MSEALVYTLEEVCTMLQLKERTAQRHARNRFGVFSRAFKVGRGWRIPREDVDARIERKSTAHKRT